MGNKNEISLENMSYIYGILGTDGYYRSQTRNRGQLSIEISEKDKDVCEKMFSIIPNSKINHRSRTTNFTNGREIETVCWSIYDLGIRKKFIEFGKSLQDKKENFNVPDGDYSKRDFWRGVIDADGSIGMTGNDEPFISVVIVSEFIYKEYMKMLKENFGIEKNLKRNARDNIYNVTLKNEDAISLGDYLYKDSHLYIDRKYNSYLTIKKWVRKKQKNVGFVRWKDDEVEYIKNHSVQESIEKLGRSKNSILMKLYHLKFG